jgi:hypothetical protein
VNNRTASSTTALPLPVVLLVLALVNCTYQWTIRGRPLQEAIPLGLIEGLLYGIILWFCTRTNLVRASILWLAIPYPLFIFGWLNLATALVLTPIFLYSLWRSLRHLRAPEETHALGLRELLAFLAILAWVNLSGAGGYGFQSSDWGMHNARLHDLVTLPWPIRYGENQNLVYYLGYFLPSAVIGKLTRLDTALYSLLPWTAIGVTLGIRWLGVLSQWRFSGWLVLAFVVFGPLDLFTVLLVNLFSHSTILEELVRIRVNSDQLDFHLSGPIGFFIGNYLSHTFQLYWSPQQVVSGWLAAGLLTYLFVSRQLWAWLFVYALLALWAPFAMIALFPFVWLALIPERLSDWRQVITFENTAGALALAAVFIVFYLSGSTTQNLSFWLFSRLSGPTHYALLAVFYLCGWGLYALIIAPAVRHETTMYRRWFQCLMIALLLLPVYVFGDFADLLCRGSAPLMFVLLMFLLRALRDYQAERQWVRTGGLVFLLCVGSGSALRQNIPAIKHYGQAQPVLSVADYKNAFPNLGPDNTLFNRWFRKALPPR